MSGGVAAAVFAAAVTSFAIILMGRRRRSRRSRDATRGHAGAAVTQDFVDVGLIVVGVAMAVGSLVLGLSLLKVDDPPVAAFENNVGVVPPVKPAIGRGVALGMAIEPEGCTNPVRVTLVVSGTAEFWRDRAARVPVRSRVLLALPDKNLSDVQVHASSDATDVTGPLEEDVVRNSRDVRAIKPRVRFGVTVIGARIRRWGEIQHAVIATFKAEWLRKRGLGSCYLVLPGLVGSGTILPAEQALGRASYERDHVFPNAEFTLLDQHTGLSVPLEPHLEPTHGSTTVAVKGGHVLNEESLPSPNETYDGNPMWTCESHPRRVEPLTRAGPLPDLAVAENPASVPVFSKAGLRHELPSICSGVAVIAEAGASNRRDLILLLMGTLISLGAALVVEVLLDWRHSGGPLARLYRRRQLRSNSMRQQPSGKGKT